MAKRHKHKKSRSGAKSKSFANSLPRTSYKSYSPTHTKLTLSIPIIDDRRRWNPIKKRLRPALTFSGQQAPTFSQVKSQPHRRLYETHQFVLPKQTAVCVRRQARREVLFALGKGGKKHHNKRARRNERSYISCKRK